jgi:hypothetical protein
MEDSMCGYVWIDIKDPSETLPVFEGVITAKILRTNPVVEQRRHLLLKKKTQVDGFFKKENDIIRSQFSQNNSNPTTAPSSSSSSISAARPKTNSSNNSPVSISQPETTANTNPLQSQPGASAKIAPPPVPKPVPAPTPTPAPIPTPTPVAMPVANLLDDDDIHSGYSHTTAPSTQASVPNIFGDDDFGMAVPSTSSKKVSASQPEASSNSGLDDIDEHPSSKGAGNPSNLSRAELAAQKSEAIEDKVRSALEFKKELDNKAEKELQDFDMAREKHEKALLVRMLICP